MKNRNSHSLLLSSRHFRSNRTIMRAKSEVEVTMTGKPAGNVINVIMVRTPIRDDRDTFELSSSIYNYLYTYTILYKNRVI